MIVEVDRQLIVIVDGEAETYEEACRQADEFIEKNSDRSGQWIRYDHDEDPGPPHDHRWYIIYLHRKVPWPQPEGKKEAK